MTTGRTDNELIRALLPSNDPLPTWLHGFLWRIRRSTWLAAFDRSRAEGNTIQAAIFDVLLMANEVDMFGGSPPESVILETAQILANLDSPERFTIPLYISQAVNRNTELFQDPSLLRDWVHRANQVGL